MLGTYCECGEGVKFFIWASLFHFSALHAKFMKGYSLLSCIYCCDVANGNKHSKVLWKVSMAGWTFLLWVNEPHIMKGGSKPLTSCVRILKLLEKKNLPSWQYKSFLLPLLKCQKFKDCCSLMMKCSATSWNFWRWTTYPHSFCELKK